MCEWVIPLSRSLSPSFSEETLWRYLSSAIGSQKSRTAGETNDIQVSKITEMLLHTHTHTYLCTQSQKYECTHASQFQSLQKESLVLTVMFAYPDGLHGLLGFPSVSMPRPKQTCIRTYVLTARKGATLRVPYTMRELHTFFCVMLFLRIDIHTCWSNFP